MEKESKSQMVGIPEASKFFGVNESVMRRLCLKGYIPAVKLGRKWYIRREYLEGLAIGE